MPSSDRASHAPHWYFIPIRVLLVTFIVTLLCFAVSLLLGIATVLIAAKLRGAHPDLRIAYRMIALPVASVTAVVALISSSIMEARHFLRAKTLYRMEHQIGHAR